MLALVLMFLSLVLALVGSGIVIVIGLSVVIGVPFLPTHQAQAKLMMKLGEVGPGKKVIDLGSGAGRLLFLAAACGATAVGYELNPLLYVWTWLMIYVKGYRGRVSVRFVSLYDADVSEADVVFAFLFPKPMERLQEILPKKMKPGSKIVSYTFRMTGLTPVKNEQGIHVYQV